MNDKIKQAFEECEKFIDEHTPEELREYEKSLNLDYEWYYGTPEQENKNTGVKYGYNDAPIEDVYNIHYDTAGNFRWIGTKSGEHIIRNGTEVETVKSAPVNNYVYTLSSMNESSINEFSHICFKTRDNIKNYFESLNAVKRVCFYDGVDDLLTIYWIDDNKENLVGYYVEDYIISKVEIIW